jgi:hypothetical protein
VEEILWLGTQEWSWERRDESRGDHASRLMRCNAIARSKACGRCGGEWAGLTLAQGLALILTLAVAVGLGLLRYG